MVKKRWVKVLVPAYFVGLTLTGCGASAAVQSGNGAGQTSNAMASTTSNSMSSNSASASSSKSANAMSSSSMSTSSMSSNSAPSSAAGTLSIPPGASGDVLVGAAGSPPMGAGNGEFFVEEVGKPKEFTVPLASGANAFRAAIDGSKAYVPTLSGKTYVVSLNTHQVVSTFSSPTGARIANLDKADHQLIITGGKSVTAYSLPSFKQTWQLSQGGNAMAVVNGVGYLSGNMAKTTQIIDLKTGKVKGSLGVGHVEDSVYDPQEHTLWLADWTNGDMTVVDVRTNKVIATLHNQEGGGFTMSNMMGSSGGFMQLAVGPNGKHVYAASFSGNIMVYNAVNHTFEKDIPAGSGAKLSGIAIDPSGKYAYTTVENRGETVAVSLATGKIASTYPGLASNRWFVIH